MNTGKKDPKKGGISIIIDNLFIVWLNINKATPTKIPINILCPKLADLMLECTKGVVSKNIIKHDRGIENLDQNAN